MGDVAIAGAATAVDVVGHELLLGMQRLVWAPPPRLIPVILGQGVSDELAQLEDRTCSTAKVSAPTLCSSMMICMTNFRSSTFKDFFKELGIN